MLGVGLSINSDKIMPLAQTYEKARAEIMKRHTVHSEDGKTFSIPDGEGFQNEIEALENEEVKVELHLIPRDLFPDEIEPGILDKIRSIIDMNESNEPKVPASKGKPAKGAASANMN
jgi:hypothetical protein